jgi:hypothetical protein
MQKIKKKRKATSLLTGWKYTKWNVLPMLGSSTYKIKYVQKILLLSIQKAIFSLYICHHHTCVEYRL